METCQAVEMIRDEQATSTAAEVEAATAQGSVSTEGRQLLEGLDVPAGLDRSATDIGESAGQGTQTAKVNAEPASAAQHQERAGPRRGGPGAGFTPDRARRYNCVRVAFKEEVTEEQAADGGCREKAESLLEHTPHNLATDDVDGATVIQRTPLFEQEKREELWMGEHLQSQQEYSSKANLIRRSACHWESEDRSFFSSVL
ncbi:unnamed protein product [Lampetra planeri]